MRIAEQIVEETKTLNDIPNDYSLLEMHLFLVIRQILKMYYNNQISKEQANNYKALAIKKYNDKIKEYEFEKSIFKEHIENIKETENLKIKLRKQLHTNTELNEILNTCIELIQIYSKEEFI